MSDYDEYQAGTDPLDKSKFPAKVTCNFSFAKGVTSSKDVIYVIVDQVDPDDPNYATEIGVYPMSIVKNRAKGSIALPAGYEYDFSPFTGEIDSEGYITEELFSTTKTVKLTRSQGLSFILDGDSDGDGVINSIEVRLKSDPNATDTDGDGLDDYVEYNAGTSLTSSDTDRDGYSDYLEHSLGTNPNSSKDKPEVFTEYNLTESISDPLTIFYLDNASGDYIAQSLTTYEIAELLSEIAGNKIENAGIYVRSYNASSQRFFLRNNDGESLEISSILSSIKVNSGALLDAEIESPAIAGKLTENSNGYIVKSSLNTIHANNKGLALSLVLSGEITYVDTVIDSGDSLMSALLGIDSSIRVSGTLIDKRISNYPILIEGSLIYGTESINIYGQTYDPGPLIIE